MLRIKLERDRCVIDSLLRYGSWVFYLLVGSAWGKRERGLGGG